MGKKGNYGVLLFPWDDVEAEDKCSDRRHDKEMKNVQLRPLKYFWSRTAEN